MSGTFPVHKNRFGQNGVNSLTFTKPRIKNLSRKRGELEGCRHSLLNGMELSRHIFYGTGILPTLIFVGVEVSLYIRYNGLGKPSLF